MNKPKHQHDCDKCKFLGQATFNRKMCDWYVCDSASWRSLIARFGEDGDYYSSSLMGNMMLGPLVLRALGLGFELTDTEKDSALRAFYQDMKSKWGIKEYGNVYPETEEEYVLGKDNMLGLSLVKDFSSDEAGEEDKG